MVEDNGTGFDVNKVEFMKELVKSNKVTCRKSEKGI